MRTPISVCGINAGKYKFQVTVPPELNGGKRERKFFVFRKHAQSFAADLQVPKDNFGTRLLQIPEPLRLEALDALHGLNRSRSLSEAVAFFVQHRHQRQGSRSVSDMIVGVLTAKKASGRSRRYLDDLRLICGDFARLHCERMISEITPEDVEGWVLHECHSVTTRNNRLRILSSAFSFAVKRLRGEANLNARVKRAIERKPVARYLSAAQANELLQAADADLRACVAIQLFAGLQRCEMAELNFENIDIEQQQLCVDKKEHTTSHRVVQIMPNLRGWLLPHRARTGKVQPRNARRFEAAAAPKRRTAAVGLDPTTAT